MGARSLCLLSGRLPGYAFSALICTNDAPLVHRIALRCLMSRPDHSLPFAMPRDLAKEAQRLPDDALNNLLIGG